MIKFLITFLLIFIVFRLVMPHLLRWAIKAFIKKNITNGTFTNAGEPVTHQNNQPEGKVNINYIPTKPKPKDFKGGEYVDYEEVK